MNLSERLHSRVESRRQIAQAASSSDWGATPTGEHWQWECGNCDSPVPITDVTVLDDYLECPECKGLGVNLRSVEAYDTSHPYLLAHLVTHQNEEIKPIDALQILANAEPVTVMRHCDRDLRVLQRHVAVVDSSCAFCSADSSYISWPCDDIKDLAEAYGMSA